MVKILKLLPSSGRSKDAVNNIALSLVGKAISVLSSLLIVPLTINYVNPTRYGIWLTLSSIIAWVSFFDLGMGNGFRNKFAEAKEWYTKCLDFYPKNYCALDFIKKCDAKLASK